MCIPGHMWNSMLSLHGRSWASVFRVVRRRAIDHFAGATLSSAYTSRYICSKTYTVFANALRVCRRKIDAKGSDMQMA